MTQPRLLLVEDNPDDVELTLEALKASNIEVEIDVVSDGVAALEFLRSEGRYAGKPRPHLILLDLNLPLMDGREVLGEIKGDDRFKRIPVLILTTSETEDDIHHAYSLNANCYLTKPVGFLEFAEMISKIVNFWLRRVELPQGGTVQ